MASSRRDFLRNSVVAGSLAMLGEPLASASEQEKPKPPGRKILILGGTGFLGPHVVDRAKARGHTLTLFNRGKTNPHLFPDIEKLHGDRKDNLKSLAGRQWDAVVDTSGYFPREVRDSAALLAKGGLKQYVFISTMSVYADNSKPGMDETSPVGKIADETTEKVTNESYGPLKALCEQAAEKAMPARVTNIRPGLIVGPGDPSDRFTYWPVRINRGGEVLAPGSPSDPIQFIDARDLADFIVHCIEDSIVGLFNATGPNRVLSIGELLTTCNDVSGKKASLTWADADFLAKQNVAPWTDMPVWVPTVGDSAGFAGQSIKRAVAKRLAFRPVNVTCRDTLKWFQSQPKERQEKMRAGISPQRETEVLAAWRKREKKS